MIGKKIIIGVGMLMVLAGIVYGREVPSIKKTKELEEKEEKMERVLKTLAKEDPKIAHVLKQEGIL